MWHQREEDAGFAKLTITQNLGNLMYPPIFKNDKPAEDIKSCRPIALTSVLSKIIKRVAVSRLTWDLEKKSSPIVLNVFINDLPNILVTWVDSTLFAEVLVIWKNAPKKETRWVKRDPKLSLKDLKCWCLNWYESKSG
ncbi:hypothetical protein CEXT_338591 [Caerostris extrusa]|uniref:Uncharacterized protein n=1 Tax=Caerostris extrusa TaxID=172846 RepID=A0AAV4QF54_CAEEX|nr:hypothetical protein CEXT_338591 [Caerostris extrusa]